MHAMLAPDGTFSADLAEAWRNASEQELWRDEYAGTEPNEYWAEGVAMWFRAKPAGDTDPRELLADRDPLLYALCERIFPGSDWRPSDAQVDASGGVPFENASDDEFEASSWRF